MMGQEYQPGAAAEVGRVGDGGERSGTWTPLHLRLRSRTTSPVRMLCLWNWNLLLVLLLEDKGYGHHHRSLHRQDLRASNPHLYSGLLRKNPSARGPSIIVSASAVEDSQLEPGPSGGPCLQNASRRSSPAQRD